MPIKRWLLAIIAVFLATNPPTTAPIDYSRDFKPILKERC